MTKISLVIAGLVGSTAAFAVPVTPADIDAARVANNLQQAWITGASAPTKSVYEGFVGPTGGCDAGTNSIFTTQSSTSTSTVPGSLGNFNAYACTRGGVVSVLYHTLDGGSLNAYTPITLGTKLARVAYPFANGLSRCAAPTSYTDSTNPNNSAALYKSCAIAGGAVVLTSNVQTAGPVTLSGTNLFNAAALSNDALAPQLPVGGFSDVESGLFPASIGGGNVLSFGTQSSTGVAQVFGVVVSVPAYRAMQAAQGVPAATIAADTTFNPAFAPGINSAQYASIASGGAYASATGWTSLVGAAGTGKRMVLERRVATSGSQASSNAFFLKNPCSSGVGGALIPVGSNFPGSTSLLVVENSGSGNVKTRITTASNAAATSASNFAIGVLSLENDWRLETDTTLDGYRFIKVDGVHPELGDTSNARLTSASGDYQFVKELVSFVRNDNLGVKTAFEAAIVGQIATALANPVAGSCATLPRGLGLLPATTNVCTVGVQVFKGTVSGNNCAPQRLSL